MTQRANKINTSTIENLIRIFFTYIYTVAPTGVSAQAQSGTDVNAILDAVAKMCALPTEKGYQLQYEGSAEGGVIVKLIGVKGEGRLSKKEWQGVEDVLEKDRASDRESSRDCTQNVLPIMLKAFGVNEQVSSLYHQESRIQSNFTAGDPSLRAVAFREAFKSQRTFFIDLIPRKDDSVSENYESNNETLTTAKIGYYDFNSGVFASYGPPPAGSLNGQLSGDIITFSSQGCSGRLANKRGTWTFVGPVACSIGRYTGEFHLR